MPQTARFPTIVGLIFLLSSLLMAKSDERTNIILIVADDLGYGELGSYGGNIPTPHLDSLARSGVRFTQAYVTAPFCAQSRAALLTGRYQTRFGYENNPVGALNADPNVGLPLGERTIATELRESGYVTALVGKWHLGGTARFHPLRRGFDEFFGFLHEGHYYVPPPWLNHTTWLRRRTLPDGSKGRWVSQDRQTIWSTHMGGFEPDYDANNPILRNSQPVEEKQSLTNAFTREAVDFIQRHKEQPFFLYLAYNAVHSPLQADNAYLKSFAHIDDVQRRIFAAMLSQLDDGVGRILETVKQEKLTERTLIVFLSDNGGPTRELTSRNTPFRGEKGQLLEGGIRVPLIVSGPGLVSPGEDQRLVSSLDLFPTLLAIAGGKPAAHLDGINLLPYLKDRSNEPIRTQLYWRMGARAAFRSGDWKILRDRQDSAWQLYHVANDLTESHDLSSTHAEKVRELEAAYKALDVTMVAPLWGAPPPPPAIGTVMGENKATPLDRIRAPKDFKVELLYSVPMQPQGSWVNLCVDPKGRIIASDQFGGLFRFPPPAAGQPLDPHSIEKIPAQIRAVNGMVWAFGALYVGVNDYQNKIPSGLYRVSDSDGDDQLDRVELLREMDARGDHGVHAVLVTPDGKGLYLVCGNGAKQTASAASSPVPFNWGEDHLLPRMPDGRGFMRDVLAPGGVVYRVSPDGKTFEIYSSGYRNIFDAALNREGELFTYDADMEYDFNTSWYRPTRICHVVSGSEFGWRNGAGKRPTFYADNLPPVIDIGPGSPTGMTFGYGAKFPARYQNALFVLDWSWGKLHAVHLQPQGSTYAAKSEEFLSGAPLPLTDVIIHPHDGAMYFTIGGRRVQSGLYRVTYVGNESVAPVPNAPTSNTDRSLRHQLEQFHGKQDPAALRTSWPHLESSDRFIRWAARTALEHQPHAQWALLALQEAKPRSRVEALLGLARTAGVCPSHRTASSPSPDAKLGGQILTALLETPWQQLDHEGRLTLLRAIQIALHRFEPIDAPLLARTRALLDSRFPDQSRELNWLLCETLVYLRSTTVASKALELIAAAPTQEEQLEYGRSLRKLDAGWNLKTRTAYFEWLLRAENYRGGASFKKFVEFIRTDALATLTDAERSQLANLLNKKSTPKSVVENFGQALEGRTPKEWTLEELSEAARTGMKRRNFDTGRKMFGAAACFACHRFRNEGGMTGPDLTLAGGRYSPHDFLDQVLHPSKEINEQFVPTVVTKTDGETIVGTVVNLLGDKVTLNTDLADPDQRVDVDRKEVKSIAPSQVSPMPPMLLSQLEKDEILDLVAYVLSSGNPDHEYFKR